MRSHSPKTQHHRRQHHHPDPKELGIENLEMVCRHGPSREAADSAVVVVAKAAVANDVDSKIPADAMVPEAEHAQHAEERAPDRTERPKATCGTSSVPKAKPEATLMKVDVPEACAMLAEPEDRTNEQCRDRRNLKRQRQKGSRGRAWPGLLHEGCDPSLIPS